MRSTPTEPRCLPSTTALVNWVVPISDIGAGQRLVRCQQLGIVHQHRIRMGAADINPDPEHVVCLPKTVNGIQTQFGAGMQDENG